MGAVNKIWDDQLHADAFWNLYDLHVEGCNNLLNIGPFGILERLQKLNWLEIKECDSLEEVFGFAEQGGNQSQDPINSTPPTSMDDGVRNGIKFNKLEHLELYYLQRLKTFCSLDCDIEFPSLEKAVIMGCPRMQSFSIGESVTLKLLKVHWNDITDEGSWKGDINTTIQEMFTEKVRTH